MAEDTPTRSKPRRRRQSGEDATRKTKRRPDGDSGDTARDEVDADVDVEETEAESGAQSAQRTVTSELKDVVREAAIEVLKPVARKATTQAAKYAVSKGPDLVKSGVVDNVKDKVGAAGGPKALAAGVAEKGGELVSKVKGDGGDAEGTGKGRRLPVQEHVDVGVSIDTAYNQWTQFEEFPKFMHRVEKLDQRDDTHLMWTEKIWGVRRQWEAEITSQRPNERIAWKSLDGTNNTGVVTFHALADNLTRVQVNLDFQPHGLFEKTASGFRMSRRALKSDLMRFKAFIEMRDEETGEWRGEIEDGDVVEQRDEDRREDDRDDGQQPEAYEDSGESEDYDESDDDRDEDEDEDGPVAREPAADVDDDEGEDDEDADDDEREEKPRRGSRTRRRAPAQSRR